VRNHHPLTIPQLVLMKEFCVSSRCRRAAILSYFGETQPQPCTGCDVCNASAAVHTFGAEIHDFTVDFRTVLELVMTNKKTLTVNQIIAVLRGTKEGQKHCSGASLGSGGSRSSKWWENVCNIMVSSRLLKMQAMSYVAQGRTVSYTVVCSTPAASDFVKDSHCSSAPLPIALVPLPPALRTAPLMHHSGSATTALTATDQFLNSISARDQELFAALVAKRLELAKSEIPPKPIAEIAFDSVLRGITLYKPSTLQQVRIFPALLSHCSKIWARSWPPVAFSEILSTSCRSMGSSGAMLCCNLVAAIVSIHQRGPCQSPWAQY
jgi:superfamily II DNA helicase RecQ